MICPLVNVVSGSQFRLGVLYFISVEDFPCRGQGERGREETDASTSGVHKGFSENIAEAKLWGSFARQPQQIRT